MPVSAYGRNLKKTRICQGLTQEELENKLGSPRIRKEIISRFENGKQIPSLETAKRLSDVLGISLDELVADKEVKSDNC